MNGPRVNCWNLHSLAVAPAYRNHEYERRLVQWGLEQARRENVAASVISAEGKEQFYRDCGYGIKLGTATEGVGSPLAQRVRGRAILFKDLKDGERDLIEVCSSDYGRTYRSCSRSQLNQTRICSTWLLDGFSLKQNWNSEDKITLKITRRTTLQVIGTEYWRTMCWASKRHCRK